MLLFNVFYCKYCNNIKGMYGYSEIRQSELHKLVLKMDSEIELRTSIK